MECISILSGIGDGGVPTCDFLVFCRNEGDGGFCMKTYMRCRNAAATTLHVWLQSS